AEEEARATNDSHREAERRRRKRINGHIATLRSILPDVTKTDKASLLGEAVRRVRELNKAAEELRPSDDADAFLLPGETDEVKVVEEKNSGRLVMKATLCCQDRPEILTELRRALKSVEARVVRAEMSTVGGRTKSVLWVELNADEERESEDAGMSRLRRALKGIME
ncbi:hypothetical protein M569_09991, partial [Genlisea aurea]